MYVCMCVCVSVLCRISITALIISSVYEIVHITLPVRDTGQVSKWCACLCVSAVWNLYYCPHHSFSLLIPAPFLSSFFSGSVCSFSVFCFLFFLLLWEFLLLGPPNNTSHLLSPANACNLSRCLYLSRGRLCWVKCNVSHEQNPTLQHSATHCNTLQHPATPCTTLHHTASRITSVPYENSTLQYTATHCNTLQHTATHCNTHCNTLQRTCRLCWVKCNVSPLWNRTLQHTAPHCNTLHHTAPHCNTLQHTYRLCWVKCDVSHPRNRKRDVCKGCTLKKNLQRWYSIHVSSSVLLCVAVCCSMLQCVAVSCSVLHQVAGCCSGLQGVAVCCSVLQSIVHGILNRICEKDLTLKRNL